jgi:hypothetical protein
LCAPERIAPTSSSNRVCDSTATAVPSPSAEFDSATSFSAPAVAGTAVVSFAALSGFADNQRLSFAVTGQDASSLAVAASFDGVTGAYRATISLANGAAVNLDSLQAGIVITDARADCLVAGAWRTGGCVYSKQFSVMLGRALCPASQSLVLSKGELAANVTWPDPTIRGLPGVQQAVPYTTNASMGLFSKGQHIVSVLCTSPLQALAFANFLFSLFPSPSHSGLA